MYKKNGNGVKAQYSKKIEHLPPAFSLWWRNNMHKKAYLTDVDGILYTYKDGRPVPLATMEVKDARNWSAFCTSSVECLLSLASILNVPCLLVKTLPDIDDVEVAVIRGYYSKRELIDKINNNVRKLTKEQFKVLIEKYVYKIKEEND
jgi:hypothetical protein